MISDLKFVFCTITYAGSCILKWPQTKETGAIDVTEKNECAKEIAYNSFSMSYWQKVVTELFRI